MVFYHGTSVVAVSGILNRIEANINENTELDFGKGFYGSPEKDLKYAKKHALKVAKDSLGRQNVKENAVVIKCEIDDTLIQNPKIISKRDEKFLDFVFDIRENYLHENLPYDFIKGPMADGNVDSLMNFYRRHKNKVVKNVVKFCYGLPFNLHEQIVIKNQRLCNQIIIIEIRNLKGVVIYEKK